MSIQPGRIRLEIALAHAPSKVWKFLTVPEKIALWSSPCDMVPVVGNLFEFDMGPWGKQACEVLAVEEERLLSYAFAKGALDTVVTWTLKPTPQGTLLELVHEGFDLDSPMAKAAFDGMSQGWPDVLHRLDLSLHAP